MRRGERWRASAPARIDLAGGTLDIWPISMLVPRAVTVNLAIELRARVEIAEHPNGRVRITSLDRRRSVSRKLPLAEPAPGSALSLLLRLVRSFEPSRGLEITVEAAAPAGAGLGGSSTLGIALGGALAACCGASLDRERLLRRVMNLETVELGVPTGNQDYLAAIHGGLAAYHHEPDGTRREAMTIPPRLLPRLVLAYTGEPRQSGYSNWEMFKRFIEGEAKSVNRLERIAGLARELTEALRAGDLDEAGRLLGEEGRLRYSLAPTVATDALRRADAAARRAGAIGVKVCGAGGGGCLVALAKEGRAGAVARAFTAAGARVLPVSAARRGLTVEETTTGALRGRPLRGGP